MSSTVQYITVQYSTRLLVLLLLVKPAHVEVFLPAEEGRDGDESTEGPDRHDVDQHAGLGPARLLQF